MALSPEQIANAVSFFTTKNTARAAMIAHPTPSSFRAGVKQTATPTISDALRAEGNKLGPILGASPNFVADVLSPQGKDQAPTNGAQWLMNLLGTGTYAAGNFLHGLGQAAHDNDPGTNKAAAAKLNNDPVGFLRDSIGEGFAQSFGGAARGVAEGFGARFDGQKPRTIGQDFEAIGLTKAAEDAAGSLGATDTGAHFFDNKKTIGGIVGTAGDVALDPATYVGGLGLLGGLKGAVKGGSEALRGAEEGVNLLKVGAKTVKGAAGGFVDGSAAAQAAAAAAKAGRKTASTLRAAVRKGDYDNYIRAGGNVDTWGAARVAGAGERLAPKAAKTDIPLLDDAAAEPGRLAPKFDAEAQLGKVNDLVPTLQGLRPREVPAGQILHDAAEVQLSSMKNPVPLETAQAISDIARNTQRVPDVASAITAARKLPGGADLLKSTVQVAGKPLTLAKAVDAAVVRRLSSGDPAEHLAAIDSALGEATKVARKTTPETLGAAIEHLAPNTPNLDLAALTGRLASVNTQAARKSILQEMLGVHTAGYKDFDEAMTGAVNGELEAGSMREMLKALGIRSRLTDAEKLRTTLAGRGQLRWQEIQNSVRTPAEVLTDNGVAPATAAAAALADEVQAARDATISYQRTVGELGYDPNKIRPPQYNADGTPFRNAGVGEAIHHATVRLGELLKGKDATTGYGRKALLEVHGGVLKTLRLRGGKLEGAARGENFIDDYLTATKAVEDYARSLGVIPRLPAGAGRQPFYASLGDVLGNLPRPVLNDALFRSFKYRLGNKVGDEAFKAGLSIYPTSIMEGARAAMTAFAAGRRGEDAVDLIRAAIQKDGARNAYQASADGMRTVESLSRAMADPLFSGTVHALHESNEIVAVKLAQLATEGLLRPMAAQIIDAATRGADRGELTTLIQDSYKQVHDLTQPVDEGATSLVHDLAQQRLDNAMVNGVLGEWGYALTRFDARAAENTAAAAGRKVNVHQASQQATSNVATLLHEGDEIIQDGILDHLNVGELDDVEAEAVRAWGEMQQELGQHGLWGKLAQGASRIATAAEGSVGQSTVLPFRVGAERSASQFASSYHAQMSSWFHGTKDTPGLGDRLGQDLGLGRKASIRETNAAMETWRTALAAYLVRAPGLARGSLHDALQLGLVQDAKKGIHDAVPALSPTQAGMAMEFYDHLNHVFQPSAGAFERSGLTALDINDKLGRYGYKDFALDENLPLAEQTDAWQKWENVESPLNVLMGFHNAMSSAMVRPTLGASLGNVFGKTATELTADEAKTFRRIDTKAGGSLARHMPSTLYFPPEVRRELPYVQRYLDEIDKQLPTFWGVLAKPVDAITSVIKPSMTIWRTGHHVTNILGNNLFLMLHGYNPMANLRTLSTLRQVPGTPELDMSGLDAMLQAWDADVTRAVPGIKGPIAPKMLSQSVMPVLKDGTVATIEPGEFAQEALRRGMLMTPHQAKDLAPEGEMDSIGGLWDRFTRSKLNVIARTNRTLSRGSAWYENITRLSVAMQAMESRTWRNMDEAWAHAMGEIQKTHPTRESLSTFDRKYTTRVILFHNWIRGALGSVMEAALERPGLVTIPSKYQYNMAEANGLDPESIGKPFSSDPRIAAYESQGLLGPTWIGGNSPFGGVGDLDAGQEPNLWGFSPSAPQIDSLTNFFGGFNVGQDPLNAARVFAGNLNPVFADPIELISNQQLGISTNKQVSANYADWLWRQTGFPASVTDAVGLTGTKPLGQQGSDGTYSGWSPSQLQGDQSRKLWNFITGTKTTNYTNPTSSAIATSQQAQVDTAQLQAMGYTKAQISALKAYWKVAGHP